jgi:hypothetical protein
MCNGTSVSAVWKARMMVCPHSVRIRIFHPKHLGFRAVQFGFLAFKPHHWRRNRQPGVAVALLCRHSFLRHGSCSSLGVPRVRGKHSPLKGLGVFHYKNPSPSGRKKHLAIPSRGVSIGFSRLGGEEIGGWQDPGQAGKTLLGCIRQAEPVSEVVPIFGYFGLCWRNPCLP